MKFFQRTAAILLLMAGLSCPSRGNAAFMTTGDLAQKCQSAAADLYQCVGYVAGIIDYHIMLQSLGTVPAADFCLPEGTEIEQAAVTVIRYLKAAPQHGDFIAAPAVLLALNGAYPCAPPKR